MVRKAARAANWLSKATDPGFVRDGDQRPDKYQAKTTQCWGQGHTQPQVSLKQKGLSREQESG